MGYALSGTQRGGFVKRGGRLQVAQSPAALLRRRQRRAFRYAGGGRSIIVTSGSKALALRVAMLEGYGLGFSLKPPKALRKLSFKSISKIQPGKVLAKVAVPLAITAGALLIPGVAPAALAAARGGAGLAARGITGAAGLLGRGAGSAFKSIRGVGTAIGKGWARGAVVKKATEAVSKGDPISDALKQVASAVLPGAKDTPPGSAAMPSVSQTVNIPGTTMAPGDTPTSPAAAQVPAMSADRGGGGGGGGAPMGPDYPAPLDHAPTDAGAPSSNAPLWIAGGIAAALGLAMVLPRPSRARG